MENKELAKLSKFTLVIRDNEIIQAKNDLTATQNKFIDYVIARVRDDKNHSKKFTVMKRDFSSLLDITDDSYMATRMAAFIADIVTNKGILIFNQDEGSRGTIEASKYFKAKYFVGEGYAEIEVDDTFYNYFINLTGRQYTAYHLQITMAFKSTHAIQLYKLLKQYMNIPEKKREFDLDKFKLLMGVFGQYKEFNMLKKRVIDIAVNEINNSPTCDIRVQWEPKKIKNKHVGLTFFMIENPDYKSKEMKGKDLYAEGVIDVAPSTAAEVLQAEGIHELDAKRFGLGLEAAKIDAAEFVAKVRKSFENGDKAKPFSNYLFGALTRHFKK